MATIKSYTDIEQSKKLAEILPIESADIVWVYSAFEDNYFPHFRGFGKMVTGAKDIKAWSLAALLGILPIIDNRSPVIPKTFDGKYRVTYHSTAYERSIITSDYDNPVDACVAMVEKLHELKML